MVTILSNILCSTNYFSLSWTSAALNKCYTYISIQTYLISLIGKQVQLMLIMIIWKIKKSDRNWFELQCQKQLPVIHFTEFVLICYLETGWKADYRCFENKVTSSFYKTGRVRINLQKKNKSFLYACESSHIIKSFFGTVLRTVALNNCPN